MFLTISNQTHNNLLFRIGKGSANDRVFSVHPFSDSARFSPKGASIWLARRPNGFGSKELADDNEAVCWATVNLPAFLRKKWERVTVEGQGDFPCTMYRNQISRKYHILVVIPSRDPSCFLASVPDSTPLSSLTLPGTHETMSLYGWPISQCQTEPLDAQLHAGIRVVDLRLSIVNGRLIAHHGIVSEVTPFADILVTLHNFLTSPTTATETVVVSIKQEDNDTEAFPGLVYNEISASPGGQQMWFLENTIPTLGQVRGKAVMFSRFGSNTNNGIHPPLWPDSDKNGFQWECGGTLVQTQDWYDIQSFTNMPEKFKLATEILIPPSGSPTPTLAISFSSASSFPLALPPVVALGFGLPTLGLGFEGVNQMLGKWLLDQLGSGNASRWRDTRNTEDRQVLETHNDRSTQIRGWLLMDYYQEPATANIVPLLIEFNFRASVGEKGDTNLDLLTSVLVNLSESG